jgi:hypothetical protein
MAQDISSGVFVELARGLHTGRIPAQTLQGIVEWPEDMALKSLLSHHVGEIKTNLLRPDLPPQEAVSLLCLLHQISREESYIHRARLIQSTLCKVLRAEAMVNIAIATQKSDDRNEALRQLFPLNPPDRFILFLRLADGCKNEQVLRLAQDMLDNKEVSSSNQFMYLEIAISVLNATPDALREMASSCLAMRSYSLEILVRLAQRTKEEQDIQKIRGAVEYSASALAAMAQALLATITKTEEDVAKAYAMVLDATTGHLITFIPRALLALVQVLPTWKAFHLALTYQYLNHEPKHYRGIILELAQEVQRRTLPAIVYDR